MEEKSTRPLSEEDIETLRTLLSPSRGVDLNSLGDRGYTYLHAASHNGFLEMAKILLDNGADPNITSTEDERTPLHEACINKDQEMIKILLDNGADPNIGDVEGDTPLHEACSRGYLEIVKLLLENGADLNVVNEHDETPLHCAAENGYLEIVKLLLSAADGGDSTKRVDPNVLNIWGANSLYWASGHGHVKIVKILLDNEADPDVADDDGRTPLRVASRNQRPKVVKLLETYFPSLQVLALRSLRKHGINITKIPLNLFP